MFEMTTSEVTFPAIARARQHFLIRSRRKENARDGLNHDKGEDVELEVSRLMLKLGLDLDNDLLLVREDVRKTQETISREYERVCASVDTFTAALTSGCVFDVPTPYAKATVRVSTARERRRRCHVRQTTLLVFKAQRREPHAATDAVNPPVEVTRPLSRAARLAKEATYAIVIQSVVRQFLYTQLYRGGRSHLHTAIALHERNKLMRWMRRWQCFLGRRRRFKRKLERRIGELETGLLDRCIVQAEAAAEIDGKYGQAKEFHRVRRLGVVMATWLHAVI